MISLWFRYYKISKLVKLDLHFRYLKRLFAFSKIQEAGTSWDRERRVGLWGFGVIAKQKITYEYHVTKLKKITKTKEKDFHPETFIHFVNFEEGLFGIVAIPEKDRQRHPGWKQLPLRHQTQGSCQSTGPGGDRGPRPWPWIPLLRPREASRLWLDLSITESPRGRNQQKADPGHCQKCESGSAASSRPLYWIRVKWFVSSKRPVLGHVNINSCCVILRNVTEQRLTGPVSEIIIAALPLIRDNWWSTDTRCAGGGDINNRGGRQDSVQV